MLLRKEVHSQDIARFLDWVEGVHGNAVRELCKRYIDSIPASDEFDPDVVLGECYDEHNESMVESAEYLASIRYRSRVRLTDASIES